MRTTPLAPRRIAATPGPRARLAGPLPVPSRSCLMTSPGLSFAFAVRCYIRDVRTIISSVSTQVGGDKIAEIHVLRNQREHWSVVLWRSCKPPRCCLVGELTTSAERRRLHLCAGLPRGSDSAVNRADLTLRPSRFHLLTPGSLGHTGVDARSSEVGQASSSTECSIGEHAVRDPPRTS